MSGTASPLARDAHASSCGGAAFATAVVTGAAQGLGLALCRKLADAGATVIGWCRGESNATTLHRHLDASHGAVVLADVTDPSSVRHAARHTADLIATTPGGRLSLLVNNAGIGAPPDQPAATAEGPLAELQAEAMHRVLAVNAIAPALVTQALAPLLAGSGTGGGADEGGGIVANISSDLGSTTNATEAGGYAYAMSKAALNMLTASSPPSSGRKTSP